MPESIATEFEKLRREFHGVSLWRGKLWLWLQNQSETILGEAEIKP
jgi:hypothetical protein